MSKPLCLECGKEIEALKPRRNCCSDKCRELNYNRRHTATFSPERKRAAKLIASAIASGSLTRQPCEVCGKTASFEAIHAHHDDYAKPLDVRWLCRSHHRSHHHKFGPGKNAFLATPVTGA